MLLGRDKIPGGECNCFIKYIFSQSAESFLGEREKLFRAHTNSERIIQLAVNKSVSTGTINKYRVVCAPTLPMNVKSARRVHFVYPSVRWLMALALRRPSVFVIWRERESTLFSICMRILLTRHHCTCDKPRCSWSAACTMPLAQYIFLRFYAPTSTVGTASKFADCEYISF